VTLIEMVSPMGSCEHGDAHSGFGKNREFEQLNNYHLLKERSVMKSIGYSVYTVDVNDEILSEK
jgi:hypothetical protein